MRVLDMSPYQPFRRMGVSCRTRPLRDKQVLWVKPEPLLSRDGRFVGRVLSRADVPQAAVLWRRAYPEIYGSQHDFLLHPEDYDHRVALLETWEQDSRAKPTCMLVAEERATQRLAAATLMTKFDANLEIQFSLAGTDPDFRRLGLMNLLGRLMYPMAKASGAEYLTTFLETWHTITQDLTLRPTSGWRVAGIFPGNMTRWAGGQEEYRAWEVYLYRFINNGERYATRPREWHLHPELQRLWEALEEVNRRLGREPWE